MTPVYSIGTTDASSIPRQRYPALELGVKVLREYAPILYAIGILGDMASFLIALKKHNREIPTGVHIGALAAADGLCLLNTFLGLVISAFIYDDLPRDHQQFANQ